MKLRAEKVTQINGLSDISQEHWIWKLRVLTLEKDNVKKSPALEALTDWAKNQKSDFKKIKKVILLVGQAKCVREPKHVKKSSNPKHENVYEIRADKGHARLMFFYSEDEGVPIFVCTNSHWKGKGSQDQALKNCNELKIDYEQQKLEETKNEKHKKGN